MTIVLPQLAFARPLYGPDHPKGPSVGPDVLAVKRVLWRWDPLVFPGPALAFDDVFNRRVANALRVAQRFWNLTPSGNLGKTTFERMLRALRGRGVFEPRQSAWDDASIALYKKAYPRVPPAKCFIYPKGAEATNLGGVAAHTARPLGNWQSDNAIDVGTKPWTLCLAPKAGFVSKVGGKDPHEGPSWPIFGEHVTIDCPDGDAFFFTHLDRIVGVGESLVAGQVIGRVADWPGGVADHAHMGRIYGRNPEELWGWPRVSLAR